MAATINTDKHPAQKQTAITMALQAIANNLDAENILFLGKLANKPNINKTLTSKKGMIEKYL